MSSPQISVIIPTLARIHDLERCLDSLSRQRYKDFEVVIVTNTRDELEYLFQKYPDLRIEVVEQEAPGLSNARNAGLAKALGWIVSFIDDDVVLSDSWAKELIGTFNKAADIAGVSGPTIIPQEIAANRDILAFHNRIKSNIFCYLLGAVYNYIILENKPYAIGRIFKSGGFSLGSNYPEVIKASGEVEVDYLEACNMSFRKDVLDKTGGFSMEYKGIGDWSEPDLAFRVRSQGYKLIFNPNVLVSHLVSQGGVFIDRGKDSYQRMLNFIHFYYKWIKPDRIGKAARFAANLLFLNMYWLYKFISTGKSSWLGGVKGIFGGLRRQICKS